MGRKKNIRFKEIEENFNVIQSGKALFETIKGNWSNDFFKNNVFLSSHLVITK